MIHCEVCLICTNVILQQILFHECLRESSSGRAAYNIYLGKHNEHLGRSPFSCADSPAIVPSPENVNHAGLSVSSWYKKAIIPIFVNGVFINFIESLQKLACSLQTMKIVGPLSSTFYCDIIFDSKAINLGTEVYQDTLYGTVPPIKAEEAKTSCENGYKEMLQTMILDFAEKRRSWIKQAEVYMLQFLDIVVAVPIAVFYLTQDGTSDDVKQRTALVLKYVSSCNNCLSMSKETGQPPECRWFCHLCMRYKRVCDNHAGM